MFNFFNIKEFFDYGRDPIVAIDFSAVSIKALFLVKTNQHWSVEWFAQMSLLEGVCDGMVIKSPEVFAKVLQALFRSLEFKTNKVMIALPDSIVITKTIQVNEGLSEAEIEELIMLEFDSYIPYPLEEVDFDFEILGPSTKKKNLYDVLLVATRKENLQSILTSFSMADLEVMVVDVLSYTFERSLPLLLTTEEKTSDEALKLILIFDLGATHTRLYAFSEENVVFTREEDFGGQQLLESASVHSGLSEEVRDSWLRGKIPSDLSEQLLADFNITLITQLNRSIEFFFSVSHFNDIHRIYLAGGLAHLPGLVAMTEQKLNIPVFLANPFIQMSFSPKLNPNALLESSGAWVSVCGLAVREKRNL